MKKIIACALAAACVSTCVCAEFSDTGAHWANKEISWAEEKAVINGYPDGSFMPENTITRAEALKTVAAMYNIKGENKSFSDVSENEWYYKYITEASEIMPPVQDGLFRPDENITRQDALYCIIKAKFGEITDENTDKLTLYNDSYLISDYAKQYAAFAVNNGILQGYEDNLLRLNGTITRAEFVKLLYTADNIQICETPDPDLVPDTPDEQPERKLVSNFIPVVSVGEVNNESGATITRINGLKGNTQIAVDTTESYVNNVKAGDVVIPVINHKYLAKSCYVLASLSGDTVVFDKEYMKGRNTSEKNAKYYFGEIAEVSKGKNVTLKKNALSDGTYSLDFSINGDTEVYFYDKSAKNKLYTDDLDILETDGGKLYVGSAEYKTAYTVAREIDGDITEIMIYLIK